MSIYKINTYSSDSVNEICRVINDGGGKCATVGLAIVTDYSFNQQEANFVMRYIGGLIPEEFLTDFDLNQFNGVK